MQFTNQQLFILLTAATASGIPLSSILPRALNLSQLTLPNITITGTDPFSTLSPNKTAALTTLKQLNNTGTDFCRALSSAQPASNGHSNENGILPSSLSFLSSLFRRDNGDSHNYNELDNVNRPCGGCGRTGGCGRSCTYSRGSGYNNNRINNMDTCNSGRCEDSGCGGCAEKRRRQLTGGPESENLNINPGGSTFSSSSPSGNAGGESNVNINGPSSGPSCGSGCACPCDSCFGCGGGGGSGSSIGASLGGGLPPLPIDGPIDSHAIAVDAIDNALSSIGNSDCLCKRDNVFGDVNLNIFNQITAAYGNTNGTATNGTNSYQINGVNVPEKLRGFQPTALRNACGELMEDVNNNGGKNTTKVSTE